MQECKVKRFFTLDGNCTYYKYFNYAFGLDLWHMWYFLTFETSTKQDRFYLINLLPCLLKQAKHNLTCNVLKYSAHLHKISSGFTLILMQCCFRMLFLVQWTPMNCIFLQQKWEESQMVSFTIFKAVLSESDTNAALSIRNQEPGAGSQKTIKWNSEGEAISWQDPSLVSRALWCWLSGYQLRHIDGLTYLPKGKYFCKTSNISISIAVYTEYTIIHERNAARLNKLCAWQSILTNVASLLS